ncbi:MAG TPA: hypothetical protein VGL13_06135 [Polyangiaceae bacterium]
MTGNLSWALLAWLALAGCGQSSSSSSGGTGTIQTRLSTPAIPVAAAPKPEALSAGAVTATSLESLKYYVRNIQVCESLEVAGSGFNNATGCLSLYHGDESMYAYDPMGDFTPLADAARQSDVGFVDLMSETSRAALGGATPITHEDVRNYNYGIITWTLPIKLKATTALNDGSQLYTHDGTTTFETVGTDSFRDYFTTPSSPLDMGPAEEAVVLLGNGGNWFRFQNPLAITTSDVDDQKTWVLDLVFNPEGIVKGFAGDGASGNLRERDSVGNIVRAMTVPLLDLTPVPHRADQSVVRESYVANVDLGTTSFDARIELYSVDGDPNNTIYGVDAKGLVAGGTHAVPPEMSKISFLSTDGGTLSFLSWSHTPIITGFTRLAHEMETTTASIVCSTFADTAGSAGGSAIVLDTCPSPSIGVTFTLVSRTHLTGSIAVAVGVGADGGDGG